jgi:hypothetical protein
VAAWGDVPTWIAVIGGSVGGYAALRQLSLQRQQLADQQKLIAEQNRSLGRQQASMILVEFSARHGGTAGVLPEDSKAFVHQAMVINQSGRPIRNIAARITPHGQTPAPAAAAAQMVRWDIASGATAQLLAGKRNSDRWLVLGPGASCALMFAFELEKFPNVQIEVRFADDVGVDWEVRHDLQLVRLDARDGW